MADILINSLDELREIVNEHITEGTVLSVEFVGKEDSENDEEESDSRKI